MHTTNWRHLAVILALAAGVSRGASAQAAKISGGYVSDSTEIVPMMQAALADVRGEFPFGRILFERVVIDTSKRLAPPLLSRREHKRPEDWAVKSMAESVLPDATRMSCNSGNIDCQLPAGVEGIIGFSDPTIRGDTAELIVRYSKNTGGIVSHVRTTVEALTLAKKDGEWKVVKRKVRATV